MKKLLIGACAIAFLAGSVLQGFAAPGEPRLSATKAQIEAFFGSSNVKLVFVYDNHVHFHGEDVIYSVN